MRFRGDDTHALHALQKAFALAVHLLDESLPNLNEVIAGACMKLPEGWEATVDVDVSGVLSAVPKPQTGAAPFAAAAVNVLSNILEASKGTESPHLAIILVGVARHCKPLLGEADSGCAAYGACMATMHAAPRILTVLRAAGEAGDTEGVYKDASEELSALLQASMKSPADGYALTSLCFVAYARYIFQDCKYPTNI